MMDATHGFTVTLCEQERTVTYQQGCQRTGLTSADAQFYFSDDYSCGVIIVSVCSTHLHSILEYFLT